MLIDPVTIETSTTNVTAHQIHIGSIIIHLKLLILSSKCLFIHLVIFECHIVYLSLLLIIIVNASLFGWIVTLARSQMDL